MDYKLKENTANETLNERDHVKKYTLDDLEGCQEQQEVVYTVLQKLKEWTTFYDEKEKNPDATFEPLLLTVNGAGGTGKTFIIKVILTCMKQIFPHVVVTIVCAPTGTAAYNIEGQTMHLSFGINVNAENKELSIDKRAALINMYKRILAIIVDERSMLSREIFGATERNCRHTMHGGQNLNILFGGVPIVILLGDDQQLPTVRIGEKGKGAPNALEDSHTHNRNRNYVQQNGMDMFLQFGKNVRELTVSKRVNEGNEDFKKILQNIRNGGVTQDEAKTLMNLHVRELPPYKQEWLKKNALWVFATRKEKDNFNATRLRELVCPENPIANIKGQSARYNGGRAIQSHFDNSTFYPDTVLCRDERVEIKRNYKPKWGLYNGSIGTVRKIKFAQGKNPNKNDLPEYVLVDIDDYVGPQWSLTNKTLIPIPMATMKCKFGCCEMKYCPLQPSFARTIHTTQGREVGPDKKIPAIVLDPGTHRFETVNPGLLYSGVSRASGIGNGDPLHSSLFFTGIDICEERLTNVKYSKKATNGKKVLKGVEIRENWIEYLKTNTKQNTISEQTRKELKEWAQNTTIEVHELDEIIEEHNRNYIS